MRKFLYYATGIIWRPQVVVPQLVDEPNKKLMTIYAVLWNNLLLLGFVGVVTFHRVLTWSAVNIKSFPKVLPQVLIFLAIALVLFLLVMLLELMPI